MRLPWRKASFIASITVSTAIAALTRETLDTSATRCTMSALITTRPRFPRGLLVQGRRSVTMHPGGVNEPKPRGMRTLDSIIVGFAGLRRRRRGLVAHGSLRA